MTRKTTSLLRTSYATLILVTIIMNVMCVCWSDRTECAMFRVSSIFFVFIFYEVISFLGSSFCYTYFNSILSLDLFAKETQTNRKRQKMKAPRTGSDFVANRCLPYRGACDSLIIIVTFFFPTQFRLHCFRFPFERYADLCMNTWKWYLHRPYAITFKNL